MTALVVASRAGIVARFGFSCAAGRGALALVLVGFVQLALGRHFFHLFSAALRRRWLRNLRRVLILLVGPQRILVRLRRSYIVGGKPRSKCGLAQAIRAVAHGTAQPSRGSCRKDGVVGLFALSVFDE